MSGTVSGFWSHCLNHFERELSAQQFATWFRVLSAENRFLDHRCCAQCICQQMGARSLPEHDRFARDSLLSRATHRSAVASAPSMATRKLLNALHRQPLRHPIASPATAGPVPETPLVVTAADSGGSAITSTAARESTLNSSFTFDSFVTGKANQLARAAAMQVAGNPGDAYNPLFIYGGVGLGKTHLLQAIGNQLLREHPTARVRYIHAERYVSDVVKAYQHKAWDAFKQSYASLDLLLIDDIQFFNNKSSTQEQFFYLFNALTEAKKQVIITCDTYPKEIEGIEDRLKSRFSWGLTVQIEPPETEMRVAILLAKAKQVGVSSMSRLRSSSPTHPLNVRELEGGLKRVIAYAGFHNVAITPQVAKEALRDLLAVQSRQISIENIQKTVADYYKIKVSDMHSKKRSRIVARPRQMAMALAKELTPDVTAGNRAELRWPRSHHRAARLPTNRQPARATQNQIQHDFAFLLQGAAQLMARNLNK